VATVAAGIARLRNLQTGHIRAQRRICQDIDKLLDDAARSEERAGTLEAIAEHADQLVAALARQQQIEAAMRDQAAAEAPEPAAQASQTIDSKGMAAEMRR
jgi:hypothetical protein